MMYEFKFNIDKYELIFKKVEDDVIIEIKGKSYKMDINRYNFFASNILNANNEIEYLRKRRNDYNGVITKLSNKNDKIIIEKYRNIINITLNNEKIEINIEHLSLMAMQIYKIYEKIYNKYIELKNIDTMYLANFLWKRLNYITHCKIDYVYIDDLYAPCGKDNIKIIDTVYYKALLKKKEIFIPTTFKTNHLNESNYERVLKIFESVKKNKYPLNNQYIILYNDELKIRDGQHRACSLRYLYGNIQIPIMRIYIDNEKYKKYFK